MGAALDALTGWTLFAGLTLSIGAVVARWAILPRASSDDAARLGSLARKAAGVGLAGVVLTAAGVALYFVRQLLEFRDPFVPWTEDAALLLGTSWGSAWTAAVVATLFLAVALPVARTGRRSGWLLATPVALALAAFPGLTGHAAGVEDGRLVALLADGLHVTAAGAWIGGLAVVLHAGRDRGGGHDLLEHLVPAFSPVAIVGASLLILTGTYAAWLHLPDLGALFRTAYGRTLLAKLSLVAIVLGFGARNFRLLTPRLGSSGDNRAMRRSATLELLVAQLVLLATALLVRISPMDH